jgi:hypothetical protein
MSITPHFLKRELLNDENFTYFLQRQNLRVDIVSSTNFIEYKDSLGGININICDPQFISNEYETLSYALLEEENVFGIFLSKYDSNNVLNIIVSVIINVKPEKHIRDMASSDVDKESLVELILACSNVKNRIPQAARQVLLALQRVCEDYDKNLILRLAKGLSNSKALKFYTDLGFKQTDKKQDVLLWTSSIYVQHGGRIRRLHTGIRGGRYIVLNKRRVYV